MGGTGMIAGEVMGMGGEGVMELRWRMSEKGEGVKVEEMESRWRRWSQGGEGVMEVRMRRRNRR